MVEQSKLKLLKKREDSNQEVVEGMTVGMIVVVMMIDVVEIVIVLMIDIPEIVVIPGMTEEVTDMIEMIEDDHVLSIERFFSFYIIFVFIVKSIIDFSL